MRTVGGAAAVAAVSGAALAVGPSFAAPKAAPRAAAPPGATAVEKEMFERFSQTSVGETFKVTNEHGTTITLKRTAKSIEVVDLPGNNGPSVSNGKIVNGKAGATGKFDCIATYTSIILGIGAAAFGIAALTGVGLAVGSIYLTPYVCGVLSGGFTTGAVLEQFVAYYIC